MPLFLDLYPEGMPEPSLFPELEELRSQVLPSEYEVLSGTDKSITFNGNKLRLLDRLGEQAFPFNGIHWLGWYSPNGVDETGIIHKVVSFLYHKLDSEGKLETEERAIVLEGIGYGEHSGHRGQPPSWYLIGSQIGTVDHRYRQLTLSQEIEGTEISTKHFSVACITNGPLDPPILANPKD